MSRPGALPKYLALAEALTRDIHAGRYAVGVRLPGERDMAEALGVAVGTLRNALSELEDRGLLRRVQGSGNYVQKPAEDRSLYAFFRLETLAGGGLPTARVMNVLHTGAAWRIRRVRCLDDAEVALEEIHVDLPKQAALDQADLSDSLYFAYRTQFDLWVTSAEDSVGVGTWPDWAPFSGPVACGLVKRKAFARDGAIAEWSHTWFDQNKAQYMARLGGTSP